MDDFFDICRPYGLGSHEDGLKKLTEEEQRYYRILRDADELWHATGHGLDEIATIVYCGIENSGQYTINDVRPIICALRKLNAAIDEFYAKPHIRYLESIGYTVQSTRDEDDI